MGEIYTVAEVAEKLKTSERTIQDHIRAGELVAFPVGRGKERFDYRIDEEDFVKFKEEQKKALRRPISVLPTANKHRAPASGETGGMGSLERPVVRKRSARR